MVDERNHLQSITAHQNLDQNSHEKNITHRITTIEHPSFDQVSASSFVVNDAQNRMRIDTGTATTKRQMTIPTETATTPTNHGTSQRYRFNKLADLYLLKYILRYKPFRASYGMKQSSWEHIRNKINQTVGTHSHLLTARACRDRFKSLASLYSAPLPIQASEEQRKMAKIMFKITLQMEAPSESSNSNHSNNSGSQSVHSPSSSGSAMGSGSDGSSSRLSSTKSFHPQPLRRSRTSGSVFTNTLTNHVNTNSGRTDNDEYVRTVPVKTYINQLHTQLRDARSALHEFLELRKRALMIPVENDDGEEEEEEEKPLSRLTRKSRTNDESLNMSTMNSSGTASSSLIGRHSTNRVVLEEGSSLTKDISRHQIPHLPTLTKPTGLAAAELQVARVMNTTAITVNSNHHHHPNSGLFVPPPHPLGCISGSSVVDEQVFLTVPPPVGTAATCYLPPTLSEFGMDDIASIDSNDSTEEAIQSMFDYLVQESAEQQQRPLE